jgi:hypothetical protein
MGESMGESMGDKKYKFNAGSRVELYNVKTGEKVSFHAIDAKACLQRGGWSLDPVAVDEAEPASDIVPGETEKTDDVPLDFDALCARAAELKLAAPSTLKRWSAEKLQAEIAMAEAAVEAE